MITIALMILMFLKSREVTCKDNELDWFQFQSYTRDDEREHVSISLRFLGMCFSKQRTYILISSIVTSFD